MIDLSASRRRRVHESGWAWVVTVVAMLVVSYAFALARIPITGEPLTDHLIKQTAPWWPSRIATVGLRSPFPRIFGDRLPEGIELTTLIPHLAITLALAAWMARFGIPRIAEVALPLAGRWRRLAIRSSPAWLGWSLLGWFFAEYWSTIGHTWWYSSGGVPMESIVSQEAWDLRAPLAGATLGYVMTIAWLALRSANASAHAAHGGPSPLPVIGLAPCCVACGYEAAADRPCPECGLENPLVGLGRVYFGRWHARLMLSRWRWVAVLPWVAVAVMLFWPLISGLARHWLG